MNKQMLELTAAVHVEIDATVRSLFTAFCANDLTTNDMLEISKAERALSEKLVKQIVTDTAREIQHDIRLKYGE